MRAQTKTILASVSIVVSYVIASYVIREKVLLARQQKTDGVKLSPIDDKKLMISNEHLPRDVQLDEVDRKQSNTTATTTNSFAEGPECRKFHLITTYFVGIPTELNTPHFKKVKNHFGKQYHDFSQKQFDERNKEYVDTLQHNLNHPCVEMIHLFYVKEEDLQNLTDAHLTNFKKLHPVKHERTLHMVDFFLYASRNLVGKPVVALNGDIELEEGLEKIDVKKMMDNKLLYSLSRYERKDGCQSAYGRDMCTKRYGGSHDCHIFVLAKPLNETLLMEKLDFPINMFQSENGMIYTMRYIFKFNVTNPCLDVKIYHHHCSKVHGPPGGSSYSIKTLGFNPMNVRKGFAHPCKL